MSLPVTPEHLEHAAPAANNASVRFTTSNLPVSPVSRQSVSYGTSSSRQSTFTQPDHPVVGSQVNLPVFQAQPVAFQPLELGDYVYLFLDGWFLALALNSVIILFCARTIPIVAGIAEGPLWTLFSLYFSMSALSSGFFLAIAIYCSSGQGLHSTVSFPVALHDVFFFNQVGFLFTRITEGSREDMIRWPLVIIVALSVLYVGVPLHQGFTIVEEWATRPDLAQHPAFTKTICHWIQTRLTSPLLSWQRPNMPNESSQQQPDPGDKNS